MASQIRFFKKNALDISNTLNVITVTDATATNTGQTFVDYLRNRNNTSAWLTTGSNDAANTTLELDFGETKDITSIIMILHNFDSYTLKYWNGSAWTDFSTIINVTGNTASTTFHEFTSVATSKLQLIITGTMVADADKQMRQFIATEKLVTGQLNGWPEFQKPTHSTNKKVTEALSGKIIVTESIGAYEVTLKVDGWNDDDDLNIVEEIYFGKRGVLVWPCGGDETQFSTSRIGYRLQDIYFMRGINDYTPEFRGAHYRSGLKISMKMKEAID